VFNNPVSRIDPLGLCAVNKAWNLWSGFSLTTWNFWKDKSFVTYNWLKSLNGVHDYKKSVFGNENLGLLNVHGKSEIDFRAGTLRSGVQASVGQVQWQGSRGRLSNVAGLYHWNFELAGGITNIGTLGGIEAKAKIAAFEGKVVSDVRIGSIYIRGTLGGTLGSYGLEGKAGTRGIKIGLHALIGATVGLEWGFLNK
jgi:hypothetical protein